MSVVSELPDPGGTSEFLTPTGKRTFGEVSPADFTPKDGSRRRIINSDLSGNVSSPTGRDNCGEYNYCDLVSQATDYLSKINELVNDQGSRMNVGNKTAIMDITQRITGIVSMLAIKSFSNEAKLANFERQMEGIATQQTSLTYADKLKLRLPPKSAPCPVPTEARVPRPCVIAYPTTERLADYATSSATKQALMKAIKPSDEGFQIVGVKKTSKAGVVLRVANERQLKKLESVDAIKSAGLRLEKPKGRKPRIIVKDVPGSMEDRAFLTALYRQNIKDELKLSENDFIKSTKIVRHRKLENGRQWIGLELEAAVRKHLANTKDKLYIDWATCRFIDDIEVVRCLNCQQFGHVQKFCTIKTPTCANCAAAHETRACPDKDTPHFKPTCAQCKRFKKPSDHRCGSHDCATYKLKLEQLILNTNY
ncbi:unnamed protein product [Arctia plantaginis]|uniref:Gag-like protein n=1 Tax=Arctia plantaginis TaxID=874455 RepID=A0A8S0YSC6_ARCPL|nr:unnamed protein product [Arctia plantaginis]